jgi:uncharacterized protein (TIGR03032 family)
VPDAPEALPRTPAPAANDRVEAKVSKGLGEWLRSHNVSLLVSSYQSGRLVMIGADKAGKVVIRQERFDRAMGIAVRSDSLLLATLHQLWLFRLSRRLSAKTPDSERILIPQAGYHTGFVNCHDVAFVGAGVPVFASVLFNCVGMVTAASSFVPLWAPAFIKELVPEDRCHLNGLAVDGGRLRVVTALGAENSKQAWRQNRSQGVIFDAASKRAVVTDLWMPHSPRIHERRLWLHESGRGSFGVIERGKFVEKLFCPGYTRGLDFHGTVAAIGISKPRAESIAGLPLEQRLAETQLEPASAVLLFDTATSNVLYSIEFQSIVSEIYEVAFLTGTSDPRLIHPASDEAMRAYHIGAIKKRGPAKKALQ